MSETNLFEIEVLDEDHSSRAKPTAWLKSLPIEDQLKKLPLGGALLMTMARTPPSSKSLAIMDSRGAAHTK